MNIIEEINKIAQETGGKLSEKKGVFTLEVQIAERKAFLSNKKLLYVAKFRPDEEKKVFKFTEMLKESGFGLSTGNDDFGMSPGFGFKKTSYNTFSGAREGTIEEQSKLFGKDYSYKFDYGKIRKDFEKIAKAAGYKFAYQILSIGL
ncbi:hypothetical protein D4S03_10545 [bacterium]|nr:MAG: hypothetical protein D4S03_10545 [bacterium]